MEIVVCLTNIRFVKYKTFDRYYTTRTYNFWSFSKGFLWLDFRGVQRQGDHLFSFIHTKLKPQEINQQA